MQRQPTCRGNFAGFLLRMEKGGAARQPPSIFQQGRYLLRRSLERSWEHGFPRRNLKTMEKRKLSWRDRMDWRAYMRKVPNPSPSSRIGAARLLVCIAGAEAVGRYL